MQIRFTDHFADCILPKRRLNFADHFADSAVLPRVQSADQVLQINLLTLQFLLKSADQVLQITLLTLQFCQLSADHFAECAVLPECRSSFCRADQTGFLTQITLHTL